MKNEVSLKRLVLVKRLYLEGVDKAGNRYNYADQMLAVVNLFLSVETLMRAVVWEVDQQPDKAIGTKGYVGGQPKDEQVRTFKVRDYHKFEQLYNQVVAILRDRRELGEDERLFKWSLLKRLQLARNDAQHDAKAPHPNDLPELVMTAESFVERVLGLHFAVLAGSLAEISLADLIEDQVLREYLKSAETALAQGQLQTCGFLARIAFLLGRKKRRFDWWRDRGGGRVIDDYDVPQVISENWMKLGLYDKTGSDPFAHFLWEIMTETNKLPPMFDNWVLGLDVVDRHRLNTITPRLVSYEGVVGYCPSDERIVASFLEDLISEREDWNWAGPHFHHSLSKNDALWALDYVTETVMRWQREERGLFAPVHPKYIDALSKLEGILDDGDEQR